MIDPNHMCGSFQPLNINYIRMKKIPILYLLILLPSFQIAWNEIDFFRVQTAGDASDSVQLISGSGNIKVAAVQMHSSHSLKENVEKICMHLSECAQKDVRLAVFPELVRLPAIKGARLVFYLSCESNITSEKKIEPYRPR